MLQEGVDEIMLKGLYGSNPVEVHYKCYGLNETLLTDKVTTTISELPKTWDELFAKEPNIFIHHQKITKWNQAAPVKTAHYYTKFLDVETHIKGVDNVKLVYQNACQPGI